ncbi:MAG TPA: hypothetical protein VK483_11565 [Chitinophagaceae bacterium]|nr:hypothetical protein [Chitinophagaceae bacterium]
MISSILTSYLSPVCVLSAPYLRQGELINVGPYGLLAVNCPYLMQEDNNEKEIVIKPCNHTQLAAAYGISPKVLRNKLRPYQNEIGKRKGYKYSLEQLLTILELIGLPPYPIK